MTDKIHFPLHKNKLFFQLPVAIFRFAKDDIFQPDLASMLLGMALFPRGTTSQISEAGPEYLKNNFGNKKAVC